MNREEQRLLCKQAKSEDSIQSAKATRKLLELCEGMISSLAFTLGKGKRIDNADLRSAGRVGALEALHNYKPEFRNTFKTYASFWITGAIVRAIWDSCPIYVPECERHSRKALIDSLLKSGTQEDLELIESMTITDVEYDDNKHEDSYDHSCHRINKDEVEMLLACLPERDADVMRKLYGIGTGVGFDTETISESLGVGAPRISQIRTRSLRHMRNVAKISGNFV